MEELPVVVQRKILSLLSWEDKIKVATAIPIWKGALMSSLAWENTVFSCDIDINEHFVSQKFSSFERCLRKYGKYMRRIDITLCQFNIQVCIILHSISSYCNYLRDFYLTQHFDYSGDLVTPHYVCLGSGDVNSLINTIKGPNLKNFHLIRPYMDWDAPSSDNNIIYRIIEENITSKVVSLDVSNVGTCEHSGNLDILTEFTNLKSLSVQRVKVNNDLIMSLVKNGLQTLSITQQEEIPLECQEDFNEVFWFQVLKICPCFKVDLILRFIMVVKESFPRKMPLRTIVLDDLVNIITKGVLDHFTDCYHETLVNFTYTNSFLECYETGDKRLPYSLVKMVKMCSKLESLSYGFPLSSTSILLIVKTRKLKTLMIPLVEVSYEFDWNVQSDWEPDFVNWLMTNGRNEKVLQKTVSQILGFDWELSTKALLL